MQWALEVCCCCCCCCCCDKGVKALGRISMIARVQALCVASTLLHVFGSLLQHP